MGQKALPDSWSAPWTPEDPAAYMEGIGVVVNHIHIGSLEPPTPAPTRRGAAAAAAAVLEATGASLDLVERPEPSEAVSSSGFVADDAMDEFEAAKWSPNLPPTVRANESIDRMRIEVVATRAAARERESKDRRNARDRDRRLKRAMARLAAGGSLSRPTPRGA